jgi:four helix bundle protein
MKIGETVWTTGAKREYFKKKTLGAQIASAADSIAFNISEGYGRFQYKEDKNFCYYCRGSARETFTGVHKAKARNLITEEEFILLNQKLEQYFRVSFGYIRPIGVSKMDEANIL